MSQKYILLLRPQNNTVYRIAPAYMTQHSSSRVEVDELVNYASGWKFDVRASNQTSAFCFNQKTNTLKVAKQLLDASGRETVTITCRADNKEFKSKIVFRWFSTMFNPIIVLSGAIYQRIGTVYTQQPTLYSCSLRMRYSSDNDLTRLYCHWRHLHTAVGVYVSATSKGTHRFCTLPTDWNVWKKMSVTQQKRIIYDRGDSNQLHKLRSWDDVLDANLALYEPSSVSDLDLNYHNSLHPKHKYSTNLSGTEPSLFFGFIYFRNHVVLACRNEHNTATVINTASRNIANTMQDYEKMSDTTKNRKEQQVLRFRRERLEFYEKTWSRMARKMFQLDAEATVHVVHMNIQGKNDCLLWTLYVARHLDDELFCSCSSIQDAIPSFPMRIEIKKLYDKVKTHRQKREQPSDVAYQQFVCEALRHDKRWTGRKTHYFSYDPNYRVTCNNYSRKKREEAQNLVDQIVNRPEIGHVPQMIAKDKTTRTISVYHGSKLVAMAYLNREDRVQQIMTHPAYNANNSLFQRVHEYASPVSKRPLFASFPGNRCKRVRLVMSL